MTTSLPHTHIRLRDLSELVAGIPYVIGFPPTDSLVLFTFRRCPDLALSTTIRVDLPRPEHVAPVVAELAAAVTRNGAVAVIAVVVGDSMAEHRKLIENLRKALADNEILLTHASWVRKVVHDEQWQCYDDPLCTGTVPDPHTSALAAAVAVAGDVTYPSREAMGAHLAPDSEEALARRRTLLNAYRMPPEQPYTETDLRRDLETLGRAMDQVTSSAALPTLKEHELVRLAIALSRTEVRDECLAIALSNLSEPAERLWTVLVRALPAPERAEPAFLLAISAYLRGSGVMAALALKITMESNPTHRLAILLDYALQKGTPPDQLRNLLMASVIKNYEENAAPDDDPPWDTSTSDEEHVTSTEGAPDAEGRDDRDLARTEPPTQEPTVPWTSTAAAGERRAVHEPGEGTAASATGVPPPAATDTDYDRLASAADPPQVSPGSLSRQTAVALGIQAGRVVTMDPLTAFLPPPTERSVPG